jgi:hydroxymethylpyrimidine kinase/phosphomethylpyrimidine kinase
VPVPAAIGTVFAECKTVFQVLISSSGAHLVPNDALEKLKDVLLPMAFIVTPNVAEAQVLVEPSKAGKVRTVEDLKTLASAIGDLGPKYVLVKGGHAPMMEDGTVPPPGKKPEMVVDVLFDPKVSKYEIFEKPYVESTSTHGTGCSLAAAIASNLAKGQGILDAVREAGQYISWAIETAPGFGSGSGPLNHLHSNYMVPFAPSVMSGMRWDIGVLTSIVATFWITSRATPRSKRSGRNTPDTSSSSG